MVGIRTHKFQILVFCTKKNIKSIFFLITLNNYVDREYEIFSLRICLTPTFPFSLIEQQECDKQSAKTLLLNYKIYSKFNSTHPTYL